MRDAAVQAGFVERNAGLLRVVAGVTAGQAADLLWLLTSFDSFDLLYTGRALPVDEVARR